VKDMRRNDILAYRFYEIFGPTSVSLDGEAPQDLMNLLSRYGVKATVDEGDHPEVCLHLMGRDAKLDRVLNGTAARMCAYHVDRESSVTRTELNELCFSRGYKISPLTAFAAPYDTLDRQEDWWAVYERDDHGDCGFLKGLGREAEATLGRYEKVAAAVRPGDRVLVIGDTGDGVWFLDHSTSAAAVVGCDVAWPSHREFDIVVDVEYCDLPELTMIHDLVRPAGVVVSTRKHYWENRGLEHGYSIFQDTQSGNRHFGVGADGIELAFLRQPYVGTSRVFENSSDLRGSKPGRSLDFGRYYCLPDVVQALTSKQFRNQDSARLIDECESVLAHVPPSSADAGAALCVLAYASEGMRAAIEDGRIQTYIAMDSLNPHVLRWQISLSYVMGEACIASGNRAGALEAYERCLSFDADKFHLSILTKQVGACLKAAEITASDDALDRSAAYLLRGTKLGRMIASADPDELFGDIDDPRFFYFGEMGEVLTLASRCAFAYEHWMRSGAIGLKTAMGRSFDLFRIPRMADRRDIALQKEIISQHEVWLRQAWGKKTTLDEVFDFCTSRLSLIAFVRLSCSVLKSKISTFFG